MTVYITNKSAHDFSEAKKYGELVFITEGKLNKYNINDMVRQIDESLANSKPEDYIVPCSLNVLNSIVCASFAVRHKRLNLLLYKDKTYLERNIVFGNDN